MSKLLAAALLTLSTPCLAASQTWIVSPDPCPAVDFSNLQAAIDNAADGDTILVRVSEDSRGDIEIAQKSLTLIGARLTGYREEARIAELTIRDLLPGQEVTIRDIEIFDGLILEDNAGPIWIEDTEIQVLPATTNTPPSTTKNEIIRIDNCASVAFTRCGWSQEDSFFGFFEFREFGGSQNGMVVNTSSVQLFECTATGARGFRGNPNEPAETDGFDGGTALVVTNSEVNVSSSSFTGGIGGPGVDVLGTCGAGGNGGAGIFVSDLLSVVRLLDSTAQGGVGGPKDTGMLPPDPACVNGDDGLPFDGPGVAQIVSTAGSRRSVSFVEPGLIREGDPATLLLEGVPGDFIFWGVALSQDHVYFPSFNGTSLINSLEVFRFGKIPPSGKKQLGLTIGDITTAGQALTIPTQGYFFDTSLTAFVTSPTVAIVIDSSSDAADGCPTIFYVDDDAANDPGPGDPTVSDPLEDGTLARPFDSIQEAVDSVVVIGSIVQLADGVYQGEGNFDVDPPAGAHVQIISENGPANCLVLPVGEQSAFVFNNPMDVRKDGLSGVRITGAEFRAISIVGSSVTIENCIIEGNSADNGGAIFIQPGGNPPFLIFLAAPLITNCFIRSNLATEKGGGIFSTGSRPEIRNCQFTNNVALDSGGAMSLGGPEGFILSGCTVANNAGGGINIQATVVLNGPLSISNSNIWGNVLGNQVQFNLNVLDVSYTNVQGGLGGIVSTVTGIVNAGPGLIDVDPLFVDMPGFDYHLSPGSPVIDAGDPAYVPLPGELDIDGESRVQGVAIDLGSDEN